MGTLLSIDLSEELERTLKAAGYTPQSLSEEARRYLAAVLFVRKVLSLEQAAQLAQMSLWDFIPFLGGEGIAVADYDEQEIQRELEAGRWLSGKQEERK